MITKWASRWYLVVLIKKEKTFSIESNSEWNFSEKLEYNLMAHGHLMVGMGCGGIGPSSLVMILMVTLILLKNMIEWPQWIWRDDTNSYYYALSNNVGPVAVIDFDFYWLVHIKFVCCFVSSSQWWYIMTITKFSVMWLDCQLLYICYQFIPRSQLIYR